MASTRPRILVNPTRPSTSPPEPTSLHPQASPPSWSWQAQAGEVVRWAEEMLWSYAGEQALETLLTLGLTTRTIRQARLGWVPGEARSWHYLHGMVVPCGITIPLIFRGALWSVKIRRADGQSGYMHVAGGNPTSLYGADALNSRSVVVFCAHEFDALLVQQEAGVLVAVTVLSDTLFPLKSCWTEALAQSHTALVTYGGATIERSIQRLLPTTAHCKRIRVPHGKDITDFHVNGGDVRGWIEEELQGSAKRA